MPGGDGTGPMGMGPMSGRAAGYCAGSAVPGFMNAGGGRGFFGRGCGMGRGRMGLGYGFRATGLPGWARAGWTPTPAVGPYGVAAHVPPMSPQAELETLQAQADYFAGALEEVRKRLDELKAAADEK